MYLREVPNANHIQFGDKQILKEFIPFLFEKVWATNNPQWI